MAISPLYENLNDLRMWAAEASVATQRVRHQSLPQSHCLIRLIAARLLSRSYECPYRTKLIYMLKQIVITTAHREPA
jgi:hypothetical protein